jgi:outer membrane protein TolC
MARSNLLDRLNHELEVFGKKAQAALDDGKLQIEQLRVRRRRDNTARDLGLLVHRRERTGEVEPKRVEALLVRLDDLEAELARLEGQLAQARQQRPAGGAAPSGAAPGPAGAPTTPSAEAPSSGTTV